MFRHLPIFLLLALHGGTSPACGTPPCQDSQEPIEARIVDLMNRLTLEEKIALLHGGFEAGGIPRLNLRPLALADGPVGVRDSMSATDLPCALSLASTWDVDAAYDYGRLLAHEMLALHKNVLFGPGIDLMSSPLGGRNFEYLGEDQYLTGRMAVGVGYNARFHACNPITELDPSAPKDV